MTMKYPQFVDMRLECHWKSELREQQTIDRWRRFKKRNPECSDPNLLVESGEFRTEWTIDCSAYSKSVHHSNNDLTKSISINFVKQVGYNVIAKCKIPPKTLIGYLNGIVMEYTSSMYNSLQYICHYDKRSLRDRHDQCVPLYNIHDERKYCGTNKHLYVGLLSAKYGSSLKFINSTCNGGSQNVQRWIVPFGNSLSICYYSTKSIAPGQVLLDDYMKNCKDCNCFALGVQNCINQK